MSIVEWDVPMRLQSFEGEILFNDLAESLFYYLVDRTASESFADLRITKDDIPQADGSILHEQFVAGYVVRLTLKYWRQPLGNTQIDEPACESGLVSMHDELMLHLRSLLNGATAGRLVYTPTAHAARMFDQIRLFERPAVSQSNDTPLVTVQFAVHSPFPYALDFLETQTFIGGTAPNPATLTNNGTAPMFPVFLVDGPTDGFEIINNSLLDSNGNPLRIVYDADLPGAISIGPTDFAEIITFNGTIVENGDETDLMAGIDQEDSDFFPLIVGDNVIEVNGLGTGLAPDVTVRWQNAWA